MSKQPLGAALLALSVASTAGAQSPPSASFPVTAAAPAAPAEPAAASPAPEAPASGGSREQVAFNLFERGRQEWEAGRHAEAVPLLIASYNQNQQSVTLLLLGDSYERLGRLHSAHQAFTSAAVLAQQRNEQDSLHRAQTRAAALEPRVPRIQLRVSQPVPPGLAITLDGEPLALSQLGVPRPMDEGVHRVEARAPGYEPLSLPVSVRNELTRSSTAQLVALSLRPVPDEFDRTDLAWWLGGAGAVVGVAGLTAMFVALAKDNGPDPEDKDQARWLAKWLCTGSALISIPALGTAGVLLYTAEEEPRESAALGLGWSGQF